MPFLLLLLLFFIKECKSFAVIFTKLNFQFCRWWGNKEHRYFKWSIVSVKIKRMKIPNKYSRQNVNPWMEFDENFWFGVDYTVFLGSFFGFYVSKEWKPYCDPFRQLIENVTQFSHTHSIFVDIFVSFLRISFESICLVLFSLPSIASPSGCSGSSKNEGAKAWMSASRRWWYCSSCVRSCLGIWTTSALYDNNRMPLHENWAVN